jgi:hypothetical protein
MYRSFTAYLQQAGVQDDKIQGFAKVSYHDFGVTKY